MRAVLRALRAQYRRAPGEAPHVPGPVPWLGVALAYGRDAGAMLAALREQHGDTFSVFLAGDRMTFVTNPHDYQVVLGCRDLDFHQLANQISAAAFGHRLEGLDTLEAHGVLQIGISQMRGEALEAMTARAQESLEALLLVGDPPGDVPGFYDWLGDVVFRATGRAVFGEGFDRDVSRQDFHALDHRFPLLLAGVPAGLLGVARARRALATAMAIGREGAAQVTVDRLRLFAEHADPKEVGAYQLAFLWATQANTLPAAFWTVYFATRDPVALRALTEEVRSVFAVAEAASPDGRARLDRELLGRLVTVDSAIDEALRLTSGSLTVRVALKDVTLELDGGRRLEVRAGERVGLYPWLTHHDPELFEHPEQYRYDRFLENGQRKKVWSLRGRRLTHPLMPFGGGVSMCPGRHFARNEIKVFVALLLRHFDLVAPPGPVPSFVAGRAGLGVFAPAHDVPMRISRVAGGTSGARQADA